MKRYEDVDAWLADQTQWRSEFEALRAIALGEGLGEAVKWGQPCYTDQGKNIAIVSWRKNGALISFLKGALLDEHEGRFVQAGQDRSSRYITFGSVQEIADHEAALRRLLRQAVEVERAGLSVEPLPDDIDYIEELQERMGADAEFREAFEALTTGRRRHYNMHFGKAKKAATRESRITECTPRILMGKGLRDCICGRSKRLPSCDGSHRELE